MHFLTFPFLSIPLPFFIPFTFPSSVSCAYILNHHLWVFAHVPLISHSFSLHEKCSLILFSLHEQCSLMLLANKHKTTYRKHISHEHVYRNKVLVHLLCYPHTARTQQKPQQPATIAWMQNPSLKAPKHKFVWFGHEFNIWMYGPHSNSGHPFLMSSDNLHDKVTKRFWWHWLSHTLSDLPTLNMSFHFPCK